MSKRTSFGTPPRDCPECGRAGSVSDTRVYDDYIRRRHYCAKKHRWTSVQVLVKGFGRGPKNPSLAAAERSFRMQAINTLIAELKGMRK